MAKPRKKPAPPPAALRVVQATKRGIKETDAREMVEKRRAQRDYETQMRRIAEHKKEVQRDAWRNKL